MEITGKIIRNIYFNEDTAYNVSLFFDEINEEEIVIVGNFEKLKEEFTYKVIGDKTKHIEHGEQIKVEQIIVENYVDLEDFMNLINEYLEYDENSIMEFLEENKLLN